MITDSREREYNAQKGARRSTKFKVTESLIVSNMDTELQIPLIVIYEIYYVIDNHVIDEQLCH